MGLKIICDVGSSGELICLCVRARGGVRESEVKNNDRWEDKTIGK